MHLNPQPLDNKANVQVSNSAMRMQLLLKLLWHIALKWVRSKIAFVAGQGFESPPQQSLVAEQKRVKLLKSKILKKKIFGVLGIFFFLLSLSATIFWHCSQNKLFSSASKTFFQYMLEYCHSFWASLTALRLDEASWRWWKLWVH